LIVEEVAMTHIIGSPCIGTKDTGCVDVCPVDCIHPRKDEPDFESEEMLYIDPETCIDCGLCVDECPVSAIWPEEEVPEEEQKYFQINADYYAKKA
jgi:NAD-dependent dihydropyrimidine dehydrogenase PreA subunit